MTALSRKLPLCPFCGWPAAFYGGSKRSDPLVVCTNDDCGITGPCENSIDWHDKGKLIGAWNRRAPYDRLVEAAREYHQKAGGHATDCAKFFEQSCDCGYERLTAALREIGGEG